MVIVAEPPAPVLAVEPVLEGTALVKATAAFASERRWLSWYHAISTAVLLTLACMACVLVEELLPRLVASILAGLLLVRMFVIYHDHQHGAILRGSRLASGLMWVFGLLSLNPSSVWRSSHDYHHKHNSKLRVAHIGSFPIMTTERYREADARERATYLRIRHPLTIAGAYLTGFMWGMCLAPGLRDPRRHWDGLLAVLIHLALGVGLWFWGGWMAVVLALVTPHLIAGAMGGYLFYAQHNFPAVSFFSTEGWTYHGAALESSSFMRMGPVMRWFTANIGFHHIHHLNAKIPFYRLPEVMAAIPELQRPRCTSLAPGEIRRCLRLKLWDVGAGCMVGLDGR